MIFAYRPDGDLLAAGAGSIVWFVAGTASRTVLCASVRLPQICTLWLSSPDGHSLAVATSAGVTLWDADHGKVVYRLTDGAASKVTMNRDEPGWRLYRGPKSPYGKRAAASSCGVPP